ncbi:MAG: DMT family transporter [bacterium]
MASFFFLSTTLKSIPVGTAYVVFTGIGAAGTVLFGIFFLGGIKRYSKAWVYHADHLRNHRTEVCRKVIVKF